MNKKSQEKEKYIINNREMYKKQVSLYGQRLQELMAENDVLQNDMARVLCTTPPAISNYIRCKRAPSLENLAVISDFFNVSLDYMLGISSSREIVKIHEPILEVPVLKGFKAKDNILDEKNIERYLTIPKDRFEHSNNLFALKINDDAMRPRLYEGDIVIVQRNEPLNNGDLGVFIIGDNEACIREYLNTGNGWLLNRLNPLCPPRHYTLDEIQQKPILCIGKVVESLTFFK